MPSATFIDDDMKHTFDDALAIVAEIVTSHFIYLRQSGEILFI